MNIQDFNSAKTLQATLNEITAIQSKNATEGAKVTILVTGVDDGVLVRSEQLEEALGSAYDDLCTSTFNSLNTALSTAKTTGQSAFDGLGA